MKLLFVSMPLDRVRTFNPGPFMTSASFWMGDVGLILDDLKAIANCPRLDLLILPKVEQASDLDFVSRVLDHWMDRGLLGSGPSFLAWIESAAALMRVSEIVSANVPLAGLVVR